MIVYYRMCGVPSTNPSPIFQEDKFKQNELCLRSFVSAYKELKPKIIFILDKCDGRYNEMIDRIVPFDKDIHMTDLGINETALLQWDMANNQDEDILFQESDYFYRPNTGQILLDGLNELGMVSPYDHLNHYFDKTLHPGPYKLALVNGYHWRTVERQTLSFAIKNQIFKDNYDIFKKYGYLDGNTWYELKDRGHELWTPIPSLATHMVRDFLAPSVDWKELWTTLM
jgi:hypothetical protein